MEGLGNNPVKISVEILFTLWPFALSRYNYQLPSCNKDRFWQELGKLKFSQENRSFSIVIFESSNVDEIISRQTTKGQNILKKFLFFKS